MYIKNIPGQEESLPGINIYTLLNQLNPVRGRLRWNTCRHKIGMGDPGHLAGPEGMDIDRSPCPVCDRRGAWNTEPDLAVYITAISSVNKAIACIHIHNPVCCHRSLLTPASHNNHKRIGLRRDTSCHAGRKNGIDPHSRLNPAQAHTLSKRIYNNCISVYVQL